MSTVLRVEYTGAEASCILTADPDAKTLSSSIGDAGAEAPDAAFGEAGVLDLTDLDASQVVDAIDALDDYSGELVSGDETASAEEILDTIAQAATVPALLVIEPASILTDDALLSWDVARSYLGTTHEALTDDDRAYTEGLINAASVRANGITKRKLASRTATIILDGIGGDILMLPEYPVSAISEIRIDTNRAFGDDTVLSSSDYDFYEDGRVYVITGLPEARRCVRVTYVSGYSPVPDDLKMAIVESIAYTWKRLRSRSIGTQSITADGVTTQFEIDIPMPAKRVIESYRREM